MKITTIYRYVRADGGTTVSPDKPEGKCTELFRIIADEGKAVTKDGENLFCVVDTDSADDWYEIDAPVEEKESEDVFPIS